MESYLSQGARTAYTQTGDFFIAGDAYGVNIANVPASVRAYFTNPAKTTYLYTELLAEATANPAVAVTPGSGSVIQSIQITTASGRIIDIVTFIR
jgi:hypothetical protein